MSTPFYQDPPDQPGLHRDVFKAWAHKLLGELTSLNYTFTQFARAYLTSEYKSDSSSVEEPDERSEELEERSCNSSRSDSVLTLDSSDEEWARRVGPADISM